MTEIPEHLLKRAQQRRAAMGQGDGGDGGDAAAAPAADASVVAAQAATPAPAAKAEAPVAKAPEVKPDPPYIAAAKARRRVPYWAMPILVLLPVWAYMYWDSVQPPPAAETPLTLGATLYSANCSGCHGGSGEGGTGPKLAGGDVLKTFKDPLDQARWVTLGKAHGVDANGNYGDASRPGGQRNVSQFGGAMPTFGQANGGTLAPDDIANIVRYEREVLSGEPTPAVGKELTGDQITAYLKTHPGT